MYTWVYGVRYVGTWYGGMEVHTVWRVPGDVRTGLGFVLPLTAKAMTLSKSKTRLRGEPGEVILSTSSAPGMCSVRGKRHQNNNAPPPLPSPSAHTHPSATLVGAEPPHGHRSGGDAAAGLRGCGFGAGGGTATHGCHCRERHCPQRGMRRDNPWRALRGGGGGEGGSPPSRSHRTAAALRVVLLGALLYFSFSPPTPPRLPFFFYFLLFFFLLIFLFLFLFP